MSTLATKFDTYVVKVPKALSKMFESKRKAGVYTKSEALRDAIRDWSMPMYEPTPEEVRAIKQARKRYKDGDYYTWREVKEELGL